MNNVSATREPNDPFVRVTAARPCPVCDKPDWCLATADGTAAICARIEQGSKKRSGDAGWLHIFRDDQPHHQPAGLHRTPVAKVTNWTAEAERFAGQFTPAAREWLLTRLGLPAGSFDRLPLLGVSRANPTGFVTTWAEVDDAGVVVGITERIPDDVKDAKKMQKGGHRGLTLPVGWQDGDGPVFVVEGPTDSAALTAAGLSAVGRPSKDGGGKLLAKLFAGWPTEREVVVVGENDPPATDGTLPGKAAAVRVATDLAAALGRRVLVALPPLGAKDVRAWLTDGERGDAGWDERGRELADALLATAVPFEPLAAPEPATPDVPPPPPVPAYKPFPVHALPPVLREFVVEAAAAVPCDPAFAALPALVIAGAAVGNALTVRVKRKFEQPPLLWLCTVGDSGTGKSPAMNPAADLAFGIDRELRKEYATACGEYLKAMEAWEDGENPDPEKKPTKPVRERFAIIDATIERLTEEIANSPRGLVVVRDELDGWLSSFARYKGKGGGSDVPNWLSMYEAGPVRYMRRTGEPREVEADRTFVAVCGGIQPGVLKRALDDEGFITCGMAARIGFAMPPKACPKWSDRELSNETELAFAGVLDTLRRLPFDPRNGPGRVNLDVAAKERFKALNNRLAAVAEDIDGGPMAAAVPKVVRLALRLALVWHCVSEASAGRDPGRASVGAEAMAAGEELARWFLAEAERVYAMVAEGPGQRDERTLAAWVARKGGRATTRDLQNSNGRKYRSASAAAVAFDGLVSAGYGRWEDVLPPVSGGRAGRVFVLTAGGTPDARQPTAGTGPDTTRTGVRPDRHGHHRAEPPEGAGGKERVSGVGCRTDHPSHPSDAGDAGKITDPVADTSPQAGERRYRPNARRGHRAHDPKGGGK